MQQPNVPYEQTTAVECEECGHNMFQQALHLRKASGLLTGTGQTSYIPIPVFACLKCNHINQEFLPKESPSLG